jgi:UDP-2-acetamido-2,6-beta-L-arabino-hexul-4-ose reductase
VNILVTGANGFIGKNLVIGLKQQTDFNVFRFDLENSFQELAAILPEVDLVFHLAGVNRPQTEDEFRSGNVDFTAQVCNQLIEIGRSVPFVLSSSVQAAFDNPYGISKRQAEEVVKNYAEKQGARVVIYRLKNLFGKWCRPNYNSVVATFCHNIARDLPVPISDPERKIELIYIDDVVQHFQNEICVTDTGGVQYREVEPVYRTNLGSLVELICSFRQMRQTLVTPDIEDAFTVKLYATYSSHLETDSFAYDLLQKRDPRGVLAEFIKAPAFGQIFLSRTAPGITRGNHYHHTKVEKFLVIEGEAIIRFRGLDNNQTIEYPVRGEDFRVVDIPPGYTHSIENVGASELITLFWANQIFDNSRPDTFALPVMDKKNGMD